MGQSATLYRISQPDFSRIVDSPDDFGLFEITKGSETFSKTFDGLEFVISKGLNEEDKELAKLIFYPRTFIGEEIDYASIDFENLPQDFDFDRQTVYYNDPGKVAEIWRLLESIPIDAFKSNFDHNELNEQEIYPGNVWNDETADNIAFNVRFMTSEFQKLKSIFQVAKANDEYLLSYVG